MKVMLAIGWASCMLIIGVMLRAKIRFLQNLLVPASVLGGIVGLILVNVLGNGWTDIGVDVQLFSELVNHFFTISFISIALTSNENSSSSTLKNTFKGTLGMGLVWCFLYAITPLIGALVIGGIGQAYNMPYIYGTLLPFAFCQGPGQSVAYGSIFETYGWENATMVAILFSVIGFIAAFLIGIPLAKLGIKRGIAKHSVKLDLNTLRGYYRKDGQPIEGGRETTCNSNIETLSFHIAIIGICYVVAFGIGRLLGMIPGFVGTSMSNMMFINGMFAAYIVKGIMRLFKVDYFIDNKLQKKITGWTTDYLVVCAFMSISIFVIKKWIVPILIVASVCTLITFVVCFYFGQRFGGENDFERTMGLYGMCTGTVPTGVALVRLIDPEFKTSTVVELGACNLIMLFFCTPTYMILLAFAAGEVNVKFMFVGLSIVAVVILIILKISKCWNKRSFNWK